MRSVLMPAFRPVTFLALLAPACTLQTEVSSDTALTSAEMSGAPKSDCDSSQSFTDIEDAGEDVLDLARPVARLEGRADLTSGNMAGAALCTVTLIAPSVFLTAGHCFDIAELVDGGWVPPTGVDTPQEVCESMLVRFNYQEDGGTLPPATDMPTFNCEDLIEQQNDATADYAVMRVDGEPGAEWPYREIHFETPADGAGLMILSHPAGAPMVLSTGELIEPVGADGVLHYDPDTLGGSSGAGVLDEDGLLIGVHTTGGCEGDENTNSGYDATWLRGVGEFLDYVEYFDQTGVGDIEDGDGFGDAVAAGDFDGDGRDDIVVSASRETPGSSSATGAGYVTVRYGSGYGADPKTATGFSQSGGSSAETDDWFGEVLAVGDFNGDGFDDLAVGTPHEDWGAYTDAGSVSIFYGSASGIALTATGYETASRGGGTTAAFAAFGFALASGDFNHDGYDDLAVGAPGENSSTGALYVFGGASGGLSVSGARITQATTTRETDETGDNFGYSLAVGNFNGGSYPDLAVGAPYEDSSTLNNVGHVIAIRGSSAGLSATSSVGMFQTSVDSAESGDAFGYSLAVGDFNDNGYDDLAIGVPFEDYSSTRTNVGQVNIAWGSRSTLGTSYTRYWQSSVGGAIESGDAFGTTLVAGDVNSDGVDDLVVGSPFEDIGVVDCGWATVQLGSSAGLTSWGSVSQDEVAQREADDHFGDVLGLGDTEGGGRNEIIVGFPDQDANGADGTGGVMLYEVH